MLTPAEAEFWKQIPHHGRLDCRTPWECVVHHPSQHPMRMWPMHWRMDRYIVERICPHGIGHPDPDQIFPIDDDGRHGCDGCCLSGSPTEVDASKEIVVRSGDPLMLAKMDLDRALVTIVTAQWSTKQQALGLLSMGCVPSRDALSVIADEVRRLLSTLVDQLKPIAQAASDVMRTLSEVDKELRSRSGIGAQRSPYGPRQPRQRAGRS